MPLDFMNSWLIRKVEFPWTEETQEHWIRNLGFYGIFLEDALEIVNETTFTVGTSIWNIINHGDS